MSDQSIAGAATVGGDREGRSRTDQRVPLATQLHPLHTQVRRRGVAFLARPLCYSFILTFFLCGRSFMSWAVFEIGRTGGLCPAGSFRWTFLLLLIQVWYGVFYSICDIIVEIRSCFRVGNRSERFRHFCEALALFIGDGRVVQHYHLQ